MIDSAMTDSAKARHNVRLLVEAVLMAAMLAACTTSSGTSEDKMGRFLVAPDKFVLFNCSQLADKAIEIAKRQKELEGLIAKAGPEAGGRLVSTVAYRPEYVELRGDMNELRSAAAAKNCKVVHGAAGGRASDNAVR
jgi:hypothetical protein